MKEARENELKKMYDELIYRNVKNNFQHMLKISFALQLLRLTLYVGLTHPLKPSLFWIQSGIELDISKKQIIYRVLVAMSVEHI